MDEGPRLTETLVRYLFRGIIKQTGKIVEGHVEASDPDGAYDILGDNGIITESLRDDPKPLNLSPVAPAAPEFAEALESALDSSSSQVAFDELTDRYRGKKVWVIDRDKIRHRVAQVVDSTLAVSQANSEVSAAARQRVAHAIQGMFNDNRNIASERNGDSIAGMRVVGSAPDYAAGRKSMTGSDVLEEQITRLTDVVREAGGLIASLSSALRNAGSGGGGRRRMIAGPSSSGEQSGVLLEIFKSNMDLRKAISDASKVGAVAAINN